MVTRKCNKCKFGDINQGNGIGTLNKENIDLFRFLFSNRIITLRKNPICSMWKCVCSNELTLNWQGHLFGSTNNVAV